MAIVGRFLGYRNTRCLIAELPEITSLPSGLFGNYGVQTRTASITSGQLLLVSCCFFPDPGLADVVGLVCHRSCFQPQSVRRFRLIPAVEHSRSAGH
jgi:hypothetical protein